MHALIPNKKYKLVRLELAYNGNESDVDIIDGVNEMLRPFIEAAFLADWRFVTVDFEERTTGSDPQEGELF